MSWANFDVPSAMMFLLCSKTLPKMAHSTGELGTAMNAFDAVDEFLLANHGVHLEEVLCDGCFIGRLGGALGGAVKVLPRLTQSVVEEDGGIANAYEGILILGGLWYSFACRVFVDSGGQRFLSDLTAFAPVEWQARIAVSA